MNKLSVEKRAKIAGCLVRKMSLRDAALQEDVAFNTVLKLCGDLGQACLKYMDEAFRGLTPKELQIDELCTFVGRKDQRIWIWKALDPHSKLMPCFHVGNREITDAMIFVENLASRIVSRPQISTDGLLAYIPAIEECFGADADYGNLTKPKYPRRGSKTEDENGEPIDPDQPKEIKRRIISGNPDPDKISTSLIERENATQRAKMGRLIRRTLGFSKQIEGLRNGTAIYYAAYNLTHYHRSIRCSPAMAAGIETKLWSMEDVAALMD